MNPSIKILILNWNGSVVLKSCLNSVEKINYDNFSTIVIDNASDDDSCYMVEKYFPNVKIFKLDHNYGYAKGYNKFFDKYDYGESEFMLLLNNDTIVKKNILTGFINATKKYGTDHIYGPKIYYMHNPKKIWYAGGVINLKKLKIFHLGIRQFDSSYFSNSVQTDYVTGCCLFTSKNVMKKLKGFDESFNMYGEDVDLCIRGYKNNIMCYYYPDVEIFHHVSWSLSGKRKIIKFIKKFNSLIKLFRKHCI